MRHKLFKAITTMAVAGLLLTSCSSQDAPKTDASPSSDVDLTGFPELKPVQKNLIAHEWFAYEGPDGTARRASLTVQEFPNGGYTEQLAKKQFKAILAEQNDGEPVTEAEYKKEWQALLKRQRDGFVYLGTDFSVEKLDDGSEEDEPRAGDGDMRLFFQIDQKCTDPGTYEIPFNDGCLVGMRPGSVSEETYREGSPQWQGEPSPFDYGDKRILTKTVAGTGGGVAFEATGTKQKVIRNVKNIFVAYDLEEGGEPIAALPNFSCDSGSAGQAILDAYKTQSDAEGGIAKRYLAFAPKDTGCALQPVASE